MSDLSSESTTNASELKAAKPVSDPPKPDPASKPERPHKNGGKKPNLGVIASNKRRAKHSMCATKTYQAWRDMRHRCSNPRHKSYLNYGGRGIKVCERWNSFLNFLSDMGEKPPGLSIGRIDNNGGYFPDNCRWETREQQQRNRRTNRFIEWDGVRMTAIEWAHKLGMKDNAIRSRIRKNWSAEKIITLPYRPRL